MMYLCHRSKAVFPANIAEDWGRTRETIGYGPTPRSVALIPNPYAPKTPQGDTPLMVCGGALVAVEDDHPAVREALAKLDAQGDTFAALDLAKRDANRDGWVLHPLTAL